MIDTIAIEDLELRTRLGITEDERRAPQRVLASVSFPVDAAPAGRSDELQDTIDYAAVAKVIRALAETERNTVERLAEDIAGAVLGRFPLPSVTVTVKKFPWADAKGVMLRITREK